MCEERPFVPEDIEGCAFVIAATDDRELNHRISALCQEKGILVNVVDDKDYCGFLFPSLVKEGKLTAGISTAGASPQIAAELRSRMARELPNQMEEILDYLESIREPAKKMIADDSFAWIKTACRMRKRRGSGSEIIARVRNRLD